MLITLPTLLDSKNQLCELLKTTLNAENEAEFRAGSDALYKWIDKLHQQLSSDHLTFSTLLLEKEGLEIELAAANDWAEEMKNYTLHKLPMGSYVYRRISPTHYAVSDYYLCANCFTNKVKSILQPLQKALECHKCHSCIQTEPPTRSFIEVIKS